MGSLAATGFGFIPFLMGAASPPSVDPKDPSTCRSPDPSADVIIAKRTDDIQTFDPHESSSSTAAEIIGNLYSTLITWDGTAFAPGLARKWISTEDRLTWDFDLSSGNKFATGNPVTSSDIIHSFKRLFKIGNAPATSLAPLGLTWDNVEDRVKSVAPSRLTISLPSGAASHLLLPFLASTAGSILEVSEVKAHLSVNPLWQPSEDNGALAATPQGIDWLDERYDRGAGWLRFSSAGSGPFRLINAVRSDEIVLVPNCHHSNYRNPHRIVVRHIPDGREQSRLLESGKLDVAWNAASAEPAIADPVGKSPRQPAAAKRKLHEIRTSRANLLVLCMNAADETLKNLAVREAIKISVDCTALLTKQNASHWSPQEHFCPSVLLRLPIKQDKNLSADRDRAKTLLDNDTCTLSLTYAEGAAQSSVIISLVKQLATIGITITLQPCQSGRQLFQTLSERKYQLALVSWSSDYLDPHSNAYTFCVNEARTLAWYCQWQDPNIPKQALAATVEPDAAKRADLYTKLDKDLRTTGPYLFLLEETAVVTTQANIPFQVGVLDNFTRYPLSPNR